MTQHPSLHTTGAVSLPPLGRGDGASLAPLQRDLLDGHKGSSLMERRRWAALHGAAQACRAVVHQAQILMVRHNFLLPGEMQPGVEASRESWQCHFQPWFALWLWEIHFIFLGLSVLICRTVLLPLVKHFDANCCLRDKWWQYYSGWMTEVWILVVETYAHCACGLFFSSNFGQIICAKHHPACRGLQGLAAGLLFTQDLQSVWKFTCCSF